MADIELPGDIAGRSIAAGAEGRRRTMHIECPNCGGRIDLHAGRIDDGRVFVCEKGRPLMREAGYRCRHCGSTVIFLEKCEPRGWDDDR